MPNAIPRAEHPRPDAVRAFWTTLNGPWAFAFDDQDQGVRDGWFTEGKFDREITVPFAYQCEKSGIGDSVDHPVVWYSRSFTMPAAGTADRTLLRFGAVDYLADVWVNGRHAGSHQGGYTPFAIDLTPHAAPGETVLLVVRAEDHPDEATPRGKQTWKGQPFACWYTPVTGIWQSVWLEGVADVYIDSFRLTPDLAGNALDVELTLSAPVHSGTLAISVTRDGKTAGEFACDNVTGSGHSMRLEFADALDKWSPDHPALYDLLFTLTVGESKDVLGTYFGMRSIAIEEDGFLLNGEPLEQRLVLDQGYWADSLLTPPSDEAIRADIEWTKKLGFNGARKHQKIEDPRYYYWADVLGLLVWGELPSAYRFCAAQRGAQIRDMQGFIERDYNHPSIIAWVPINESWGVHEIKTDARQQAFADGMYYLIRGLDGTRLISGNDGWEQCITDIMTIHDYVALPEQMDAEYPNLEKLVEGKPCGSKYLLADGYPYLGQPVLCTEYGGIAFSADAQGEAWGYNGAVDTEEAFLARYEKITDAFRALPYMRGYCYTQLTDVFQEVNGLLTMDRQPKVSVDEVARINRPGDWAWLRK